MQKQNYFTPKFEKKTNSELEYILNNSSNYDPKAIQAAIWMLEERRGGSDQLTQAQESIDEIHNKLKNEREKQIGIPIQTQDRTYRFLHWIIDTILIQAVSRLIAIIPFVDFSIFLVLTLFPIYYIYFEYKYRQTPGKMVTNSVVTCANGARPTLKTVILRTAARYIPFEGLSCLGKPSWGWHDKWTQTYVVKEQDLKELWTNSES